MAAEDAQDSEPVANGHATEPAESDSVRERHQDQKDVQHKMSAAEKRRQRKKKNKQAKQVERCTHVLRT